jgi:hypothetical protein
MSDTLIYLYGLVPADAPVPPDTLRGVEGGAVRLVAAGGLAAAVSEVPDAGYAEDALNARLEDLAWVGERGLAHEGVLDWFAERGPVVPSSLFSLHADEDRLRERLEAGSERFLATLARLRGRREWGVKLWREDQGLAAHLEELSPPLRDLSRQVEEAPPGRAFLLSRKRDTLRTEELRRIAARVGHTVYAGLAERSAEAVSLPVPTPHDAPRVLALHAAFLVDDGALSDFQRRLGELAGEFQPYGFDFEFTGPWPPYHFAETDAA